MKPIKPSPKIECTCQDCTGTLFFVATPRSNGKKQTKVAVYTRLKPRTRTLCDDCIADIHARGQAVAPLPLPVRWKRSDPEGFIVRLCEKHKGHRVLRESNDD